MPTAFFFLGEEKLLLSQTYNLLNKKPAWVEGNRWGEGKQRAVPRAERCIPPSRRAGDAAAWKVRAEPELEPSPLDLLPTPTPRAQPSPSETLPEQAQRSAADPVHEKLCSHWRDGAGWSKPCCDSIRGWASLLFPKT